MEVYLIFHNFPGGSFLGERGEFTGGNFPGGNSLGGNLLRGNSQFTGGWGQFSKGQLYRGPFSARNLLGGSLLGGNSSGEGSFPGAIILSPCRLCVMISIKNIFNVSRKNRIIAILKSPLGSKLYMILAYIVHYCDHYCSKKIVNRGSFILYQ